MEEIKRDLKDSQGLMFSGEPMSEEAVDSLLDAMEYIVRQTKVINKKYIPKNTVKIINVSSGVITLKSIINNTVKQLCKKHNTKDPFELAQCLNINIFFMIYMKKLMVSINMKEEINLSLSTAIYLQLCKGQFAHMN